MFDSLDTSASALQAQRTRMDTIAGNIASMNVTHGPNGEKMPFRRRMVLLASGLPNDPSRAGVHVQDIQQDQSPFVRKYEPGNPDAGTDGYVNYPNIDM